MRTLAAAIATTIAATLAIPLVLPMAGTALGQEADRYRLQPTDTGFARIDTATGEVSTCTRNGEQLVCRIAADERTALMERLDELEERIAALEADGTAARLPSTEEVDRALGIMERVMRGFVDVVRELGEPDRRS